MTQSLAGRLVIILNDIQGNITVGRVLFLATAYRPEALSSDPILSKCLIF